MEVRPLHEGDDRSTFRSGHAELDRFFADYAGQNQFRHHIGSTYVALHGSGIVGYVTIAPAHIEADRLPESVRRGIPRYPLPVLRLARLATDSGARNLGVGSALFRHVCTLARKMGIEYGCVGIVVDAKPDAVSFYEKFGFTPLDLSEGQVASRPVPTPMFLPLGLVNAVLDGKRG